MERKDAWKMNYKMKNTLDQKAEKEKLIQLVIVPKLRETVVQNTVNPMIEDSKQLITKIDEYDEQSHELDSNLNNARKQNKILKDAMPQID